MKRSFNKATVKPTIEVLHVADLFALMEYRIDLAQEISEQSDWRKNSVSGNFLPISLCAVDTSRGIAKNIFLGQNKPNVTLLSYTHFPKLGKSCTAREKPSKAKDQYQTK